MTLAAQMIPGPPIADHSLLTNLTVGDPHTQYARLLGRAGGQVLNGGTLAAQELTLRGNPVDQGLVRMDAPVVFNATTTALSPYSIQSSYTNAITVGFVGGGVDVSQVLTFSNSFFIWEAYRAAPDIRSLVAPAFAAFALKQGLPLLRAGSGATFNPLNPLVINAGPRVENEFVGTRTTATMTGFNWAPQVRATNSGAIMNATAITGITVGPTFNSAAGSTIGFGTTRGVRCLIPAPGLFQQNLGAETQVAYIGLDYDNMATFGGDIEKAAVRSAQSAATNAYFLRQTGNAQSVLLGQLLFDADVTGITFGASQDINMGWAGATNELFFNFLASGDDIRISNPSANRILIQGDVQATELNLNFDQFSLGAQSGALGQGVGAFVTPVRSTSINGGYVDFNLTHAGSLTVANTIGQCFAWNINAISLATITGTLNGPVAAFNVGGMTTSLVPVGVDTFGLRTTGRTGLLGSLSFPPINPAQISGTVQDWAGLLTGTNNNAGRFWALVDGTSTPIIDSIDATAAQDGDTYEITNDGATAIVFRDEGAAASATAANHIRTVAGANISLAADETLRIRYDIAISRWREIKEP